MVAEHVAKEPEFFGLRGMKSLMNGIHDLGCLLDDGQSRSNRRINLAFANLLLARTADSLAGLSHIAHEHHQGL